MSRGFVFSLILVLLTLSNWDLPAVDSSAAENVQYYENLLNRHNYTLVAYKVITEDGYILSMFRVNRKNEKLGRNTTKPPVFIMHGMTGSSFDWLIWAPNNSVALDIVNAGYDVWLGNNRGNTYSRRHIHLDPDDPNFWNFSYHEIGLYDLPAMIDRVLNETGFTKLTYLGMSQGFTSFVVMTSLRSEYNQKILVANCYAPATVLYKIKSPVMNFVKDNPLIFPLLNLLGMYDVAPNSLASICRFICTLPNGKEFMLSAIHILGASYSQINKSILRTAFITIPAGMSIKQLHHYIQGAWSGYFRAFDYGIEENLKVYNNTKPPSYDLTKVTAAMIMYYGEDDYFINNDILFQSILPQFPNIVQIYRVPFDDFNHLDFVFGKNISVLREKTLENINRYNRNSTTFKKS